MAPNNNDSSSSLWLKKSIHGAIQRGAPLYNKGKIKECYEVYLATAHRCLSQHTTADHGTTNARNDYTADESLKIKELLSKATIDANAEAWKEEYGKGAWVLRGAFDAILSLGGGGNKAKNDANDAAAASSSLAAASDGSAEKAEAEELMSVVDAMAGLDIRTHRFRLKSYPDTFVGKEAVTQILNDKSCKSCVDRPSTVKNMDRLRRFGLFHHVARDHGFKDEGLFYKMATSSDLKLKLNEFGNRTMHLRGEELVQYLVTLKRYNAFL